MRKRFVRLALLCGAVLPGAGTAACPSPAAGFEAVPGLDVHGVAVELSGVRVLLGQDGSRVDTAGAPITVRPDGDLQLAGWAARVDWRAYASPDIDTAPTLAYRDADGTLCRLARWTWVRGERLRDGGWAFFYDAAGRPSGYAAYDARFGKGRQAALQRSDAACLLRDAAGHVTRFVPAVCGEAADGDVRYVRDEAGTLLRAIDHRPTGQAHTVVEFGSDGKQKRRLTLASVRGVMVSGQGNPAFVMPGQTRERVMVWQEEGGNAVETGIPQEPWRIVRLDAGFAQDDPGAQSWDPAWQTVIVSGASDATGRIKPDPVASRQVSDALREHPGRVFWYVDRSTRFLLVPSLAPQVWAACVDAENVAPGACAPAGRR